MTDGSLSAFTPTCFLAWLARQFSITPILIIRHPCATILSQSRQGWGLNQIPSCATVCDRFPFFNKILETLKTDLEYTAAWWCIQNYVPLSYARQAGILVVSYEELVQNPRVVISNLVTQLNLSDLNIDRATFLRPSQMAKRNSAVMQKKDALSSWMGVWSKSELEQIMTTTSRFGLDFYTSDNPEPDYERLHNLELKAN